MFVNLFFRLILDIIDLKINHRYNVVSDNQLYEASFLDTLDNDQQKSLENVQSNRFEYVMPKLSTSRLVIVLKERTFWTMSNKEKERIIYRELPWAENRNTRTLCLCGCYRLQAICAAAN